MARQGAGESACDFTFHMGVTRFDEEAERDLREIVKRGISSFKIFLAYKGAFGVTDEELYKTLELAKRWCDRDRALRECGSGRGIAEEIAGRRKDRPGMALLEPAADVEAEGVHHLMTFAEIPAPCLHRAPSCEEACARRCAARRAA